MVKKIDENIVIDKTEEKVEGHTVAEELKEEITITEKPKKSKKKLIILIIVGLLIIAAAVILIIIFMNKGDDHKDDGLEYLSSEEYTKVINEYGDDIYAKVEYYFELNNKVPEFDDIKYDLKRKDIICDDIEINEDGSIHIGECSIDGYLYNSKIEYSKSNTLKPKEEPKKDDDKIDILLSEVKPVDIGADKFHATEIDKLAETSSRKSIKIKDDDVEFDVFIDYSLNNGEFSLYHPDSKTSDITYKNVTNVYYDYMDCADRTTFIIYTKDKIYEISVYSNGDEKKVEIDDTGVKSIANNGSYSGAYYVYIHSYTCGAYLEYVVKNKSGEYIKVSDGKKFDLDKTNYDTLNFVTGEMTSFGEKPDVIVTSGKAVSYDAPGDELLLIIDKDDYVYGVENGSLKKLSNLKAKKIKGTNSEYNIVMEDDSLLAVKTQYGTSNLIDAYIEIANK